MQSSCEAYCNNDEPLTAGSSRVYGGVSLMIYFMGSGTVFLM